MTWNPTRLTELSEIVARELAACSDEQRAYFDAVACEPTGWSQTPYGDESGGFWTIAANRGRVLWYNDYEEGFNVSTFAAWGTIPDDEYWCNQDPIHLALPKLITGVNSGEDWGPPQPLCDGVGLRRLLKYLKRLPFGRLI